MEGYAVGRQNGWLSINDIRRLEDMAPVPAEKGGDDYLVNSSMVGASLPKEQKVKGGNDEEQEGNQDATDDGTSSARQRKRKRKTDD